MITGAMFRDGIISAANNLSNHKAEVDALNVFPVPDGDTGTNMSMTIASAAKEVELLSNEEPLSEVSKKCASGLLKGARGNSGVILSLIFRGMKKAFKDVDAADGKDVARALRMGTDQAYKAVMKPTEGTILTVVRCAAEAAEKRAEESEDPIDVCDSAITAAKEALADTPNLLPVLKKAGVVDAGGQGLIYVLEGIKSVFAHNDIIVESEVKQSKKSNYDCFAIIKKSKDAKETSVTKLKAYFESIGNDLKIEEHKTVFEISLNTDKYEEFSKYLKNYGTLIKLEIENIKEPEEENISDEEENIKPVEITDEYGFVSVCAGDGLKQVFLDLGVNEVVSGGQTMNPSTDNIANAINKVPAKVVYVLPNNKNIIMAAEQAIPLAKDREVRVIHTKTVPEGISAMIGFDETMSVDDNQMSMAEMAEGVSTSSITFAARDSNADGKDIKKGQIMGIVKGKIKYIGEDKEEAVLACTDKMFKTFSSSIISVYYGEDVSEEEAKSVEEKLNDRFGESANITVVNGGQPVYYYIISVE